MPWMKVPGFGTETGGVSPHLVWSQTPEEARLSSSPCPSAGDGSGIDGSGIDLEFDELGRTLLDEHIDGRRILDACGRPVTTSKIGHPNGVLPTG